MDNSLTKKPCSRRAINILFAVMMLLALALSVWKLPYGLGGWDEAFYLDVPYRLIQGDALFKDEWHVSQLSAVLLTPLVWLLTKILGGTEGIMMAARWSYLILHLGVSIFIYFRMRKYGLAAFFSALLYFMFVPLSIMAPSYNTLGLALVILTGLTLSACSFKNPLPIIISGLLFAGAVLCNPFLLLAYFALFCGMLVHCILNKKNIKNVFFGGDYFSLRTFLFFTLGALILALIFFAYLFSKIGIQDVFANIPYILDDPEHTRMSILSLVPNYFKFIIISSPIFGLSFVLFILLLAGIFFDKNRHERRSLYFLAAAFCSVLGLLGYSRGLVENSFFNNIMFPFFYLGTVSFILSEKKDYRLFTCLYLLGLAYSFAMFLSSNQYMVVISMAVCASNIAGAAFVWEFLRELREDGSVPIKRFYLALALVLLSQITLQTEVKLKHVYWEPEPSELTARIDGGPADGILTNPATAARYQAFLSDIEKNTEGLDGRKILFLSPDTMFYLMAGNMRCSAFSAWTSGEDYYVIEKLMLYLDVNPDKVPNVIYIPKETSYYKFIDDLSEVSASHGFTRTDTEMATMLLR